MTRSHQPLLVLPRSVQQAVQVEAMRVNRDSGDEVMTFMLLKRVWMDNREVYQPKQTFVPTPRDYRFQAKGTCALSTAANQKLITQMLATGTHLLDQHTHPPDSRIGFSPQDLRSNRSVSEILTQIGGGRGLIAAVYDHFLSLKDAVYAYWQNGESGSVEVVHPEKPITLSGVDFTPVGSRVFGIHHCPQPRPAPTIMFEQLGIMPGEWRGVLLPSPDQPVRVMENTPGDQVFIRITGWPLDCNCDLRMQARNPISLAKLGHQTAHPWRSG